MRRMSVLLIAVSMTLAYGLPASADPPTTETSMFSIFECQLSGEPGEGLVFLESEGDFTFADAQIWLPGSIPFETEPDLFSDFEGAVVSFDGNQVTATIPMISANTGEPAGTIILDGTIGALIDEESFSERFREGNRWVEINETIRFFEATASVALDGVQFDTECSAQEVDLEFSSTNPHAFRVDFEDAFVECFGIPGSDGSTLNLFAAEFQNEAFLDIQIFAPDGNGGNGEEPIPELFGSTEIPGLSGTFDVTVPLFDPFADEEPADEARIIMTIAEGEITMSNIVFQDGRVKETVTELAVNGTVDLDTSGRHYDLDDCFGSRFESRGIVNQAEGPKMTGRPPVNDLPSGAIQLEIGDQVNQQTKAAAIEPEAPCFGSGEEPGEFFDPIGKTVWYSIEGTGGPVTVSTAGSHFDTMLGVYAVNGDNLELIECVDDIFEEGFSLQAELTWETEAGVSYLVQAGGFGLFEDPEFSSLPEYGLLKISASG